MQYKLAFALLLIGILCLTDALSVEPFGEGAEKVVVSRTRRQGWETGASGGTSVDGKPVSGCACCTPGTTTCCASGSKFMPIAGHQAAGCCCPLSTDGVNCLPTCSQEETSDCATRCSASTAG